MVSAYPSSIARCSSPQRDGRFHTAPLCDVFRPALLGADYRSFVPSLIIPLTGCSARSGSVASDAAPGRLLPRGVMCRHPARARGAAGEDDRQRLGQYRATAAGWRRWLLIRREPRGRATTTSGQGGQWCGGAARGQGGGGLSRLLCHQLMISVGRFLSYIRVVLDVQHV